MARTVMASPAKFTPRLVTKIYILTGAVAAMSPPSPTRSELDATTTIDVTKAVCDMAGWTVTANNIQTPALGSGFTSTIPGKQTAEASSLTFYADKAGTGANDIRTHLEILDTAVVVFCDGGDVAAQLGRAYPIQVSSVSVVPGGVDAEAANKVTVAMEVIDAPNLMYVIPS